MRVRFRDFVARHILPWEVVFAVLALISVGMDFGFEGATGQTAEAVLWAQVALTTIFAMEFFGRLWAAEARRQHLRSHVIDAVSLLPPLRIFRLLRLLRIVRVFSGVYRAGMRWGPLAQHRGFISLVSAWIILGFLCSVAFFAAESGVNASVRDPLDALWWGIGSLTTVGSDLFPVTDEGRLAAIVLMLVGVFLFSAVTATITSFLLSQGDTEDQPGERSLVTEFAPRQASRQWRPLTG
jgi:voltage-gated potassium channel